MRKNKLFTLIVFFLGITGCASQDVSMVNGCTTAQAVVRNGDGKVVATLQPGETAHTDLRGIHDRFNRYVLRADLYLLNYSPPGGYIGSQTQSFSDYGGGDYMGVNQSSWTIACPESNGNGGGWTSGGGVLH